MSNAKGTNPLTALLSTMALGYATTRYRWLRPLRRLLPIVLVVGTWLMNRANKDGVPAAPTGKRAS